MVYNNFVNKKQIFCLREMKYIFYNFENKSWRIHNFMSTKIIATTY
jgi:hypothetical protein